MKLLNTFCANYFADLILWILVNFLAGLCVFGWFMFGWFYVAKSALSADFATFLVNLLLTFNGFSDFLCQLSFVYLMKVMRETSHYL